MVSITETTPGPQEGRCSLWEVKNAVILFFLISRALPFSSISRRFLGAPGVELGNHAFGIKLTQRLAKSDRKRRRERMNYTIDKYKRFWFEYYCNF